jgi:hypothetical protein
MGARLIEYATRRTSGQTPPSCARSRPGDRRFDHPSLQRWPFDVLAQAFLLGEQWWHEATVGVEGVEPVRRCPVSTTEQNVDLQRDALTWAGRWKVFTDHVTGTRERRPELAGPARTSSATARPWERSQCHGSGTRSWP